MGETKLPGKTCNPDFGSSEVETGNATVLLTEFGKKKSTNIGASRSISHSHFLFYTVR